MSADNSFVLPTITSVKNFFRFHVLQQTGRFVSAMPERDKPSPPSPGPNFVRRVPDGDTHERHVCAQCEYIHYANPKIVVGAEGRSAELREAYPASEGFIASQDETPEAGAMREAREEANAQIAIDSLLGVYAVPHISQVHLMYRAKLAQPAFSAGPESLEVKLFSWDEIPWGELAFPSVKWALDHWKESKDLKGFSPFTNPIWVPGRTT